MTILGLAKDMVLINKKDLKNLIYDSNKLAILEGDGVDNWEGYNEGYDDFVEETFIDLLELVSSSLDKKQKIAEILLKNCNCCKNLSIEEIVELLNQLIQNNKIEYKLKSDLNLKIVSEIELAVKY